MPDLTREGPVAVLHLGDDENRFSPAWIDEVDRLLDQVLDGTDSSGLVTVADGRFWSNGLDIAWIAAHPDQLEDYLGRVHALLARFLTCPVPTAAAVSGHAFGAGAMLALAHDWRFMRADRGFLCLPEVDLGISFSAGMLAVLTAKLTPAQATDLLLTGRRFGGGEAQAAGLVLAAVPQPELQSRAVAHVQQLAGKPASALGPIKRDLYAAAVAALGGDLARVPA